MDFETELVPVPFMGALLRGVSPRFTYVDIETRKVDCAPIQRPNGEVLRRRWEPILLGTGFWHDARAWVEMSWGWSDWPAAVSGLKADSDELIYAATREFDEMVLKGRFSTARRAHFTARPAGWPGVEDDLFRWRNLGVRPVVRGLDVASRDVPARWPDDRRAVLVHLLRDVLTLMLVDTARRAPLSNAHRARAAAVMTEFDVAARLIERAV